MTEIEALQDVPMFSVGEAAETERRAEHSELALIARVREGDEQAFAELYRIYAPTINGVVLARVRRDEVQDIVQEVFLSAYQKLSTLRDDRLFGPWLVKIARNRAAEFYRSAKPTEALSEDIGENRNRRSEAAEVLRAIRSLSESYSETLTLRLVEGMSAKEIAERTGLKPESVRVNLHRGMELLRTRLGICGVKR